MALPPLVIAVGAIAAGYGAYRAVRNLMLPVAPPAPEAETARAEAPPLRLERDPATGEYRPARRG